MSDLSTILSSLDQRLEAIQKNREPGPDRAVLPGASPGLVERVAKGGSVDELVERGEISIAPQSGAKMLDGRRTGGISGAAQKALALGTNASGGFLVDEETHAEVMKQLRARSAVLQLGPRELPVKKELDVVSLTQGAVAHWVTEGAAIPVSEQAFAETPLLRPKELAGLVPVSNKLLKAASETPAVEEVVREDVGEVLALRADLAFMQGTGGSEPLGIRNTAGLTAAPDLGANGRQPSYDDLKLMIANVRGSNAPFGSPGWIMHPRTLGTIERLKTSTGEYLAETGLLQIDRTGGGFTLLGYPGRTTTQVPTNITAETSTDTSYIVLGSDWSEAWVGEGQQLEIETSVDGTYTTDGGTTWRSAWHMRETLIRAVWTLDFALRRAQCFSILFGVRP